MSDIAEIKKNTSIVDVIGRFVQLKKDGPHWKACCPLPGHGRDKTPSFTVTPSKNIFTCFGCKATGDVIDFLVLGGKTFKEALAYLGDPNNTAALPYLQGDRGDKSYKSQQVSEWKHIYPGPVEDGMYHHYKHGVPNEIYTWEDKKNKIIGYTCRFDLPEGKQVLPLVYAENNGRKQWRYMGFKKPRPLKNLKKIVENPEAPVLVVEGEKTWKAGEKLYIGSITTTWIGGVYGVKYTNWKELAGRVVVLWPDNDDPGFTAMHAIYEEIKDIAAEIHWMTPPKDAEKGWDLADADWDMKAAKDYASENTGPYPGPIKWVDPEATVIESVLKQSAENLKAKVVNMINDNNNNRPPDDSDPDDYKMMGSEFFKMLGVQKDGNGMVFYFYTFNTKTVVGLTPSSMTVKNLMLLAPLDWWSNTFEDDRASFNADEAADWLIHLCSREGTFSDKRMRGRGAWRDKDRIVIHAGDKLFVNGRETPLVKMESRFIYEIGEELNFSSSNPLVLEMAEKLIPLLKKLNWERQVNANLLAGWMVVAPICGVLDWRPHIWLLGAAGSGKTWIMKHIVRRLLGGIAKVIAGATTEPGLRRSLNNDALPVVFDEAEGQDMGSKERMQSILGAARIASSDDIGDVTKAEGNGSKSYALRSCFAFSSIVYSAMNQSDLSRITPLSVLKSNNDDPEAKARWAEFQKEYSELVTDEFCDRLRARTVSMIPTILKNINVFTSAAVVHLGEQRTGDQLGVLLAGAYSLISDDVVDYDKALKWVAAQNWSEEKALSSTRDEIGLINYLLEYQIRVETRYSSVPRTIGELVLTALNMVTSESDISPGHANETLRRFGLKCNDGYLYVSNSDANIQKILQYSKWPSNHNKILERFEGAEKRDSERFSSGPATRAVRIPKDTIFKDFVDDRPKPPPAPEEPKKVEPQVFKQGDVFTGNTEEDMPF